MSHNFNSHTKHRVCGLYEMESWFLLVREDSNLTLEYGIRIPATTILSISLCAWSSDSLLPAHSFELRKVQRFGFFCQYSSLSQIMYKGNKIKWLYIYIYINNMTFFFICQLLNQILCHNLKAAVYNLWDNGIPIVVEPTSNFIFFFNRFY